MTFDIYASFNVSGSGGVAVTPPGDTAPTAYITGAGMSTTESGQVAITPDGTKTYVTNSDDGTVSVIDNSTNTAYSGAGYPISVGSGSGSGPLGIAATPDGKYILVANYNDPSISVIDPATDTVSSTITTGLPGNPAFIAVTPDATTALVTHAITPSKVSVIDLTGASPALKTGTGYPITTDLSGSLLGIAITPDGTSAYVAANPFEGAVDVIDLTASPPVVKTGANYPIPLGTDGATALAVRPDGTEVWVINDGNSDINIIDTADDTLTRTIAVGSAHGGIVFNADSTLAYVTNSATISVISTALYSSISTIAFASGDVPNAIAIQPGSSPVTNPFPIPQGRLTLTSGTPVMTADVTAATDVYYTPYQGNQIPIYDGTDMDTYSFGQLTMALNSSNQTSGNLYDLFVFLNSSTVTIGAGPAWSTAPSSGSGGSRGTGSGTTQLAMTDGIWTNANSINLTNGSTTYSSIPPGEATYVGTVYMTANGQTAVQFEPTPAAGGTNNYIGIWNAYNRVRAISVCADSNTAWTYNSATARPLDGGSGNTKNRVHYVDGLGQTFARGKVATIAYSNVAATNCLIGITRNSITNVDLASVFINASTTAGLGATTFSVEESYPPSAGLNYIQGMENSPNAPTATVTFAFNGAETSVVYDGEF